ncbi:hypothetical protein [Variovorax guangxiensis]|uniref:hypothetical protein n=1 Tax=Variovorax guangxiensis TaxID=1775474 RepID=UPI00286222DE|nr:hypothetical protein [Variovorax guangxiensis]MDR6859808.1 hypothetical protein [Variovorax guangxiensis]
MNLQTLVSRAKLLRIDGWLRVPALALTLGLAASHSWSQSSYFSALQLGDTEPFINTPAAHLRLYLSTMLARLQQDCPNAGADYKRPVDTAEYLAKPPVYNGNPSTTMVTHGTWVAQAKKVEALSTIAKSDITAILKASGCDARANGAWVATAKKMLDDPRFAGPFPQAKTLCEASGSTPAVCECFASSYEMEASPRQRQMVLNGKPPIDGLRATLLNQDLALLSVYKCQSAPPIANPRAEYKQASDEKHRIPDGAYRMFYPLVANQGNRSCNIKRRADWTYSFYCGVHGVATMSQQGDVLNVSYGAHKPAESYTVLPDGKLRLRSSNPRVALDLLPPDAAAAGAMPSTTVAQSSRKPVKRTMKPGECQRMEKEIQRAKDFPNSRNPATLASWEKDYQVNCTENP